MKKLYIRFFKHKDGIIPVNSYPISSNQKEMSAQQNDVDVWTHDVVDWLSQFPDGKVDFVWL